MNLCFVQNEQKKKEKNLRSCCVSSMFLIRCHKHRHYTPHHICVLYLFFFIIFSIFIFIRWQKRQGFGETICALFSIHFIITNINGNKNKIHLHSYSSLNVEHMSSYTPYTHTHVLAVRYTSQWKHEQRKKYIKIISHLSWTTNWVNWRDTAELNYVEHEF